ncbi:phytanoyl-CoA dioxygenase family protein [Hibiscus syriacus]|uniref:Phytanoyl-CoA dioxygenase family protein n=1 Tax=Hibiscus syriacus TaxID=106335 RepID=A0A6A2WEW6_HIBSY|nr:phytanoyl-CoA dioxygenase family protein [Hibiscus syriacus]
MEKKGWLVDKRMEHKKHALKEFNRKAVDNDLVFFNSSSSSSDSSYGGFSASDTESLYCSKTKASSFVPKPVRVSVSTRREKPLFYEQRQNVHVVDYHTPKARAMKIYGDLKKMKQPISPGARLASFINSLFTTGNNNNTKKTKNSSSSTTCSSASSLSRSCLSKNSPSTREKPSNDIKRTVRFCPVSVVLDEDVVEENSPCKQKCIYEGQGSRLLPVSVPTAWKIGKLPSRKCGDETEIRVVEKSKRVEVMAREFLKEYHQNQMKNIHYADEEDEDEDDATSDSSSDLFELDHCVLMGNDRYREELPVYETTHVQTNRAITNSFLS